MTNEEMWNMRKNGATYQEIADMAGVTKQCCHERLSSHSTKLLGKRGKKLNINDIVYKGIYEYFENNLYESLTSFTRKIFNSSTTGTAEVRRMTYFLKGEHNSFFTIAQIQKMCKIVGKPFEEVFQRRDEVRE